MSQPSRHERRQADRGRSGGPTTPKHRDPMTAIYIGIAVLIVVILAGFGIANAINAKVQAAANAKTMAEVKVASATPTPGPILKVKHVVQLADGSAIGKKLYPLANSPQGGTGDDVDGLGCNTTEQVVLHIHTHLSIYDKGAQIQVPQYTGMVPSEDGRTLKCLYWLHTHDGSGIIHVETPLPKAPSGNGLYTLGMYFDVWGEPLSRNQVGRSIGPVTAYVNGALYKGNLRDIPLLSHQLITLEVGKPLVAPVHYAFPPGD